MPTEEQKRSFVLMLIKHVHYASLEYSLQWMQSNLEPEDIFSEKQLSNWAEANGYIKE